MGILEDVVIEGTKLEGTDLIGYSFGIAIAMTGVALMLAIVIGTGHYYYKKKFAVHATDDGGSK